jgi:hypothetical protein
LREATRHRGVLAPLLGALALTACGNPEYTAQLDDGSGLTAGAPVFAAGVEVGKVKQVLVAGDQVKVVFEVERQHQLAFHGDACAMALPVREKGSLYLRLGETGTLEKGAPLPQCHLVGDAVRAAVKEVGGAVNQAVDALISRLGPAAPGQAPCGKLSVRITGSAPGQSEPGQRVQLLFDNASDSKVSLPSVKSASFLDEKRNTLEVTLTPGGSSWFMPFSVPPHAKSSVGVQFAQVGAQPRTLELDVGYAFLESCHLVAQLEGP